jgi:hypothetical protein
MLPDRNVASRWVQAICGDWPLIVQHGTAAVLMTFAQCTDIGIEPSIAFHELATGDGMEVALEELGWFRAADNHPTSEWWTSRSAASSACRRRRPRWRRRPVL